MKLTEVQRGPVWENIPKQMSGTFSYQTYDWVPQKIFSVASFLLPPIWICLFAHLMLHFGTCASLWYFIRCYRFHSGPQLALLGCLKHWNRISGLGSLPNVIKMFTYKDSLSETGGDTMIIQSKIASFLFLLPTSGRGTNKGKDKVKNRRTQVEEIGWMLWKHPFSAPLLLM